MPNRSAGLRESGEATTHGGLMTNRSLAQTLALLFGVAALGAGVLGFIPGITSDLGDIKFAGDDSPSELLGIFQVSILHNIVHLLFGIAGLALAGSASGARTYLIGGGAIYVVLWLIGLLGAMSWLPANTADHWLHVALGVGMIAAGFALTRARVAAA